MCGATSVFNEKIILEIPSNFPFITYFLSSNYEKLAKCNPTFQRDNFFPSSQNIDKSSMGHGDRGAGGAMAPPLICKTMIFSCG